MEQDKKITDKERTEEIVRLNEELQELKEKTEIETMLSNNTIEFQYKDKKYRVKKPTLADRAISNGKKAEKLIEMLRSNKYVLQKELISLYKTKGISIETLDSKYSELQKKQNSLLERLAPITTKKDVDILKEEICKIRLEQFAITREKSELLESSIEYQLEEFSKSYLVYLSLEKEEEEWKLAYNSYEEMMSTLEDKLIVKASYYLSSIIFNDEV